MAFEISTD
jgi:Ca2+-binding EF-hand superfamily protein